MKTAERVALTAPVYRGNSLQDDVVEYRRAQAMRKAAADREAELRAAILEKMRGRVELRVGDFLLLARKVASTPARIITAEMIGQALRGRKGHTVLEVLDVPGNDDKPAAPAAAA